MHNLPIDDVFNFETFTNAFLLLFQIATSAGWNGVLTALMNEENCEKSKKPHSDCGDKKIAIIYLVSYLVGFSFLAQFEIQNSQSYKHPLLPINLV